MRDTLLVGVAIGVVTALIGWSAKQAWGRFVTKPAGARIVPERGRTALDPDLAESVYRFTNLGEPAWGVTAHLALGNGRRLGPVTDVGVLRPSKPVEKAVTAARGIWDHFVASRDIHLVIEWDDAAGHHIETHRTRDTAEDIELAQRRLRTAALR